MHINKLHEHRDEVEAELSRSGLSADRRKRLEAELRETKLSIVERYADDPANTEGPELATRHEKKRDAGSDSVAPHVRDARNQALRAIERNASALSAEANDRLDTIVRVDPTGSEGRYLAAVAEPAYRSAFGKILTHGESAVYRLSREEHDSVTRVTGVMSERALSEGTGSAGGFGVPYQLDPTILLSSAGVLSPMRQVARVVTLAGSNQWKGVSSDGVTAHWYAEGGEVTDDSPTLAAPVVNVQRASAFVPFSIEVGSDYAGLEAELSRLLADAKQTLESQAFLDGLAAGNAPIGILATTGGLAVAQRIQTATIATFAVGDNYLLKSGIPARFQAGAVILASPSFFDAVYRQVGAGSTTEPQVLPTRDGAYLGLPKYEWSNMVYATTTGSNIAVAGNLREAFTIVDRVGMSVELIPHLFALANNRPSGSRGLFGYWRVGSAPVNPGAARYLSVK